MKDQYSNTIWSSAKAQAFYIMSLKKKKKQTNMFQDL